MTEEGNLMIWLKTTFDMHILRNSRHWLVIGHVNKANKAILFFEMIYIKGRDFHIVSVLNL